MSQKAMLIILDGLGLNPAEDGNPLFSVATPNLDYIIKSSPHLNLSASAESVGLSWGEVGNSEVGHSNMGTGQIIWQDLPRISQTIKNGTFFKNEMINKTMRLAEKNNSSLHLVGLVSDGGVHSHLEHLFALLQIAQKIGLKDVFIHAFTDGRDTPPKCATRYFKMLAEKCVETGVGKISTISGRFYAMDRDNHWERIKKVYEAMTGKSTHAAKSACAAINMGYREGRNDEYLEPTIIGLGTKKQFLRKNDSVIIFNFRADRSREITLALAQKRFIYFKRNPPAPNFNIATMTPYETDWKIKIATIFGELEYKNPLSNLVAEQELNQLHMAETEKYAHVTYFFNGGREKGMPREKNICIASPRIEDYSQKPEMSVYELTSEILAQISQHDFKLVVVNFANPDMIGHTGNFAAAKKAIKAVDENLGYLLAKMSKNYQIYVTADHGNIEQMINPETKEIDKEHTTNPVFLIKVSEFREDMKIREKEHRQIWQELGLESPRGVLADIAPTITEILGIPETSYFSGQSLNRALG